MMSKRIEKAPSDKALSEKAPSRKARSGSGPATRWVGRAAALGMMGGALLALAACDGNNGGGTGGSGGSPTGGGDTGGSGGSGGGGPAAKADKVDILFAIDNSRSMADKQEILSLALSDLLTGLANPPCLDDSGAIVAQPATPADPCPAGSARQYKPVTDVHIGVISSSLGGHGADTCATDGPGKESNDDRGHLLDRLDPVAGGTVPTYQGKGFLAWDPTQQMNPPGEADPLVIAQNFKDMVLGVGQVGCGYESQLESVYRFLAEPDPYQSLTIDANGVIQKMGVDSDLLEQRQAFLRPDSLVIILSLSDENDCSIREEGQFFYAAQAQGPNGAPFHLPAARAICATDPDDECCFSCAQASPKDENGNDLCLPDPSCTVNGGTRYLSDLEDNINLRCFDQKRRFGIDFLYPTERYVEAFTSSTVTDRAGQVVPNPLLAGRGAGLVVFAGVVGVPWQDVANNPDDLKQGFKNGAEMSASDWDYVLGGDPFMKESIDPRSGSNTKPATPVPVTQPGTTNAINGSERSIPQRDDLQYACILPIPEPRDCSDINVGACDCTDPLNDNPLCEVDPATGNRTIQVRAKAFPGLRQLGVMKGLGAQSVVGSICASQIDNPAAPDYAYRPVVSSILSNVKGRLQ